MKKSEHVSRTRLLSWIKEKVPLPKSFLRIFHLGSLDTIPPCPSTLVLFASDMPKLIPALTI